MENKFSKGLKVAAITGTLTILGILGAIMFRGSKPAKQPNSKDYETRPVAIHIPGVSGLSRIIDTDKDGSPDGIVTGGGGTTPRILYFVPGYEDKLPGHSQKGYTRKMSPQLRKKAYEAFHGINGLGYHIAQDRFEARQELEARQEAKKYLEAKKEAGVEHLW